MKRHRKVSHSLGAHEDASWRFSVGAAAQAAPSNPRTERKSSDVLNDIYSIYIVNYYMTVLRYRQQTERDTFVRKKWERIRAAESPTTKKLLLLTGGISTHFNDSHAFDPIGSRYR